MEGHQLTLTRNPYLKIKLAVFPGDSFFIFFIDYLIKNKIYDIDLACYKKLHRRFFIPKTQKDMLVWNDFVHNNHCRDSVPGFHGANQINSSLKYGKITTGPYLINCAIQMGYKDISIIGFDFYSEKSGRKYPITIPKSWKRVSIFNALFNSVSVNKRKGNAYDQGHSIDADISYIKAIVNKYKDLKFHVYVDADYPYKNWQKVVDLGVNNVIVCKMEGQHLGNLPTHCVTDIKKAINEYKSRYFWKDKIMNASHLFSHKKVIIKNSLLIVREYLIKLINSRKS